MNPLSRLVGKLFTGQRQSQSSDSGLEMKKSAVGQLLGGVTRTQLIGLGAAHWTGRTYDQLAREGYRKNAVAHRAVRILAECAASVTLLLYRGDQRLTRHPLLDLMARPNPLQSGTELMESLYAFLEIAGNSYLEAAELANGRPGELYILRPDRMRVVPGPNGWPSRYEYKVAGRAVGFPVDQATGAASVMHIRTFHPQDDYYGIKYDVTVGKATGSPAEPDPTTVQVKFWYKDGAAGWVLIGTRSHANFDPDAVKVITNVTKTFSVSGVAQNDDFGISKGTEIGNASTLVGMDNFTYETATAPASNPATLATTGDVKVNVAGPDDGGIS